MTRVAVVGGGAAGVSAAIAAARAGARVTVLERGAKPLGKLRVSGNGRGNLMNEGAPVYYGDAGFAAAVLEAMPPRRVRAFWQGVGVTLISDAEGRVYPASLMASVAAEALEARLERLGALVLRDHRVTGLARAGGGFEVRGERLTREPPRARRDGKPRPGRETGAEPFAMTFDRVILAPGGAAAPSLGTDGGAYALAVSLGHSLVEPRPALCALVTRREPIAGLEGQRARARLTLADAEGRALAASEGEALFAEDGVSGIAAMQLARFAAPGCLLRIDLRRAVVGDADADARAWLKERARALGADGPLPASALLTGAVSPQLARALLRFAGAGGASGAGAIFMEGTASGAEASSAAFLNALADAISGFTLAVEGTRGFGQAQVTAGGLAAREFDPQTMQSRLAPGLYAAGEALDVDGDCGGFNLMFAVASGLLAGEAAARG